MPNMSTEHHIPDPPERATDPGLAPVSRKPLLGQLIFVSRWILYPVNIALLVALVLYVGHFLLSVLGFVFGVIIGTQAVDSESLMLMVLGAADSAMVGNLIIGIILGSHQIFIQKFQVEDTSLPQFLVHMDSTIQKVKLGMSITGITFVQLLRDFVHLDTLDWSLVTHRIEIHMVAALSTLLMAVIWRIMHPAYVVSGEHK